jgi:hypothetical protein
VPTVHGRTTKVRFLPRPPAAPKTVGVSRWASWCSFVQPLEKRSHLVSKATSARSGKSLTLQYTFVVRSAAKGTLGIGRTLPLLRFLQNALLRQLIAGVGGACVSRLHPLAGSGKHFAEPHPRPLTHRRRRTADLSVLRRTAVNFLGLRPLMALSRHQSRR